MASIERKEDPGFDGNVGCALTRLDFCYYWSETRLSQSRYVYIIPDAECIRLFEKDRLALNELFIGRTPWEECRPWQDRDLVLKSQHPGIVCRGFGPILLRGWIYALVGVDQILNKWTFWYSADEIITEFLFRFTRQPDHDGIMSKLFKILEKNKVKIAEESAG